MSKNDIYTNIGKIITGKKEVRTKKEEIAVFDSTGLAIQNIAIANIIYKKATKSKKARYISFM